VFNFPGEVGLVEVKGAGFPCVLFLVGETRRREKSSGFDSV
jgi:hypothetical protein